MHQNHMFNSTRVLVQPSLSMLPCPHFHKFSFLFLLSSFSLDHIFIGILIPLCFPLHASMPPCIATCVLSHTRFIFILFLFYIVLC